MLIDIEQREHEIVLSYYNADGEISFKKYPISQYYNWIVTHQNDNYKAKNLENWDGRPVKRKKAKQFNKFGLTYFLDSLPEQDQNEIFAYNTPRTYFVDIETEIVDGFPKAEEATSRILTFSIITPERKVVVLGLKDLSKESIKQIETDTNNHFSNYHKDWEFTYFKFSNEYEMLYAFLGKFMPKFPMMSGWNFVNYDWQYIYNRCKRLKIDMAQFAINGKLDRDGRPLHTGILDYMSLYDKYDQTVKVKESNTLDFVSDQVLNVSKIKYTGSLQQLYEQNFQKYVYYNIVDSCLVYYIDQELRCMDVLMALAAINKMTIYKADAPVSVTETKIARKLSLRNRVVGTDYNKDQESKNTQYDGAYVKKPISGYYYGIASVDYKSLYPSSMRQFNTSPEVFIEKINESEVEERRKNDPSVIVCENGAVFSKNQSVVRDIMDEADDDRQNYKQKHKYYYKKALELEEYLNNS